MNLNLLYPIAQYSLLDINPKEIISVLLQGKYEWTFIAMLFIIVNKLKTL